MFVWDEIQTTANMDATAKATERGSMRPHAKSLWTVCYYYYHH